MPLRSLVLADDPCSLPVIRRVLDATRIEADVCGACEPAMSTLHQKQFDAVIVDCDDVPRGAEVLSEVRRTASNRHAVAFAIINGRTSVGAAYELGANFVLDKPLTADLTHRALRAAKGLMIRERRRYSRHATRIPVLLSWGRERELHTTIVNLGEGGMAVESAGPLEVGSTMSVRFRLPGTLARVEAQGVVAWAHEVAAGIRFLKVLQVSKLQLERWISQQQEQRSSKVFINATRRF